MTHPGSHKKQTPPFTNFPCGMQKAQKSFLRPKTLLKTHASRAKRPGTSRDSSHIRKSCPCGGNMTCYDKGSSHIYQRASQWSPRLFRTCSVDWWDKSWTFYKVWSAVKLTQHKKRTSNQQSNLVVCGSVMVWGCFAASGSGRLMKPWILLLPINRLTFSHRAR